MRNITSIILIIVAIVAFVFIANPRFDKVSALKKESATFDDALDRSKELISLRGALLTKYNSIPTEDRNRLDVMLPNSIDTVRLIIDINTLATRYGLSLSNISVGEVNGTTENDRTLGPSFGEFGSVSLGFTVSATYDQFRAYLADLERSLRLLDVKSIAFTAGDTANSLTNYTISLTTYWLK
ncbi:MAG: hypothetical protein AAB460_02735 [Patescibacteria group bacterium]